MGLKGWIQLDRHRLSLSCRGEMGTEAPQLIEDRLFPAETAELRQHLVGGATAVQQGEQPGLLSVGQIEALDGQPVEIDQCRADLITQRTAERTEHQIHQSGVTQQQPWFLAGLQPQGLNGGHQQAEQLHLRLAATDAEQFNAALKVFLNALTTLIGGTGAKHRARGPEPQRSLAICKSGAGGSGDGCRHLRAQPEGVISHQTNNV